jgi:hypothetical protein
MSESELARRYRWWLALYPWDYRRDHEEEMLAVLLEGARPGQEFPRVVESLDLIWGALRMRLRLGQRYPGNIGSGGPGRYCHHGRPRSPFACSLGSPRCQTQRLPSAHG